MHKVIIIYIYLYVFFYKICDIKIGRQDTSYIAKYLKRNVTIFPKRMELLLVQPRLPVDLSHVASGIDLT